MIQVNKILVPVDFSETSDKAIHYGLSLALQFRARLVVAHIVRPLATLEYTFPTETFDLETKAYASAKERLPQLVPWEFHDAVNLMSIVKVGDVRNELLEIIRDENIDLVVMGTHGRGALEHFFLGSVTEKMLRKSPVPILTVSHLDPSKEIRMAEPAAIRRIVYANDLSMKADVGLHYAAELARTFGSELVVLHAVDALELGYSALELGQLAATTMDSESARLNAVLQLEKAAEAEHIKDLKVETVAVKGIPHQVITSYADSTNADLIVLNMQSKGVLERAMLGATAERVIRAAHAPVLSIPVGAGAHFLRVTPAA